MVRLGLQSCSQVSFNSSPGRLKLGQWFRAVSPAVIHGMLAGIGILIFSSQFHVMMDNLPKKSGLNIAAIPGAIREGLPFRHCPPSKSGDCISHSLPSYEN